MTRRVLVVLHRYVGLATAVFLLIIGLTGALLAWLHPISAWLSPELYDAPGRGTVMTLPQLMASAQAAEPRAQFDGYPLRLTASEGVELGVAGKLDPAGKRVELGYDTLWLDPVTGAVLGRVDAQAFPPTRQNLMNFVYRLHYALAIPGRWGVWIMGIVAILWFFDCFVGFYLSLPRLHRPSPRPHAPHQQRSFWSRWRPAWGVKRKRLNYDLHRAGGLWPWLLLATLALSGVYFNLADQVFMPLFKLVAQTTPDPFDTRPLHKPGEIQPAPVSADQAAAIAMRKARELAWMAQPAGVRHRAAQGFWQVYFEKSPAQWATAGNYGLFIDDHSGEVFFVRTPRGTGGDVFLDWLSALHVGGVFGTPYKFVLCVLGVAIAMLSITGVVIWARKRRLLGRLGPRRPVVSTSRIPAP